MSLNLLLSDSDRVLNFPFQETQRIQNIFDRLYSQNNFSLSTRLMFKGTLLNQSKEFTVKECGLNPGDTIIVINHLKINHVQENLKQVKEKQYQKKIRVLHTMQTAKDKAREQQLVKEESAKKQKKGWMDLLRWPTSSSSHKDNSDESHSSNEKQKHETMGSLAVPEEEDEIEKVTPELVAKITDAKKIAKVKYNRKYEMGSGDPSDIFSNLQNIIFQMRQHEFNAASTSSGLGGLRREESRRNVEPDPSNIEQLVEMGFPEERVKKVLKHFKNSLNLSMDYLINTPEENDYNLNPNDNSSSSSFTPNEESLTMLLEMGYEREDAIYALRVTSNNLEHACNYLSTNPNPSRAQAQSTSGSSRIGLGNLFGRSQRAAAVQQQEQDRQMHIMQETARIENVFQQLMMATQQLNNSSTRSPGNMFRSNNSSNNNNNQ